MKKTELIFGIIGLVLVFAMLAGIVAFASNYEDIVADFTSSGSSDETSDSTNSTEIPSVGGNNSSSGTNDSFYVECSSDGKEDIGYRRVGEKVYFFVVAHAPEDKDSGMCFDDWTVRRYLANASNIESDVYSLDGGLTWTAFSRTAVEGDSSLVDLYMDEYVASTQSVYICYSVQLNCSDPMSFLNTMKNALGDRVSYYYSDEGIQNIDCIGCGGIFTRYEDFVWYEQHLFDQYESSGSLG